MLREIQRHAGDCALHAIAPSTGGGHRYLAAESFRAMEGVDIEEAQDSVLPNVDVHADVLSVVTLNVDGLGEYTEPPASRMGKILDQVLQVDPDVLAMQEVTAPMLERLRSRLPDWKVYRRSDVSEYYFNVTAMK